jgi:hypothetical protein
VGSGDHRDGQGEVMGDDGYKVKNCPHCGAEAYHESTVCEEVVRCRLCPAAMIYDGSGLALVAMWNARNA